METRNLKKLVSAENDVNMKSMQKSLPTDSFSGEPRRASATFTNRNIQPFSKHISPTSATNIIPSKFFPTREKFAAKIIWKNMIFRRYWSNESTE